MAVSKWWRASASVTDYHLLWLEKLPDDVTIEGSAMNGVAQGAEARSIVTNTCSLYTEQVFSLACSCPD